MANVNLNSIKNIRTMEDVAYLLNILFTNLNNLDRVYYDMFINPIPMDITLQRYDDLGNLVDVVLPNRAKDKVQTYSGVGSPNGVQIASIGALYIDTSTKNLYYKSVGTDAYGWVLIWSDNNSDFLRPDGDGSQLTNLNMDNAMSGTLSVTRGGTGQNALYGIIKGDGENPVVTAEDGVDYLGPSSMTGLISMWSLPNAPKGWLICNGSSYNPTTYSRLFSVLGYSYGRDGNNFRIPDLRGYFIRGFKEGITQGLGAIQQGYVGGHTHTLSGSVGYAGDHAHVVPAQPVSPTITYASPGAYGNGVVPSISIYPFITKTFTVPQHNTNNAGVHNHSLSGSANDNNPNQVNMVDNVVLNFIIKY